MDTSFPTLPRFHATAQRHRTCSARTACLLGWSKSDGWGIFTDVQKPTRQELKPEIQGVFVGLSSLKETSYFLLGVGGRGSAEF